eukprot:Platyproteum_vivax@DN2609_c0_g1_i1.p1
MGSEVRRSKNRRKKNQQLPAWIQFLVPVVLFAITIIVVQRVTKTAEIGVFKWVKRYGGFVGYVMPTGNSHFSPATSAGKVASYHGIAFVPNDLVFSYNRTSNKQLSNELTTAVATNIMDTTTASVLALIAEMKNGTSMFRPWFNDFPKNRLYAANAPVLQKRVMEESVLKPIMDNQAKLIEETVEASKKVPSFQTAGGKGVTVPEARWGVMTRVQMMSAEGYYVPTLELALPTWKADAFQVLVDRTLGLKVGVSLVAVKDTKRGEAVFLYHHGLSVVSLLANFAHYDPSNPVFMYLPINLPKPEHLVASTQMATTTWHQFVRETVPECKDLGLFVAMLSQSLEIIDSQQMFCSTTVYIESINPNPIKEVSFINAFGDYSAYFNEWPRKIELALPHWIEGELSLFASLRQECLSHLERTLNADSNLIRKVSESSDYLSVHVIKFRKLSISRLEICHSYFSERYESLFKLSKTVA